jgi:phosphoribosylamine--glycine ligase
VVKTDGLAAGKGVLVTESLDEAIGDVRSKLSGDAFGDAGRTIVIEEGLTGPELSVLAVCDGQRAVALAPAQDFKRAHDGEAGPNTGGMGAYSPVPFASKADIDTAFATCVGRTLEGLRARGIDYRGVLYTSVMLTPTGPRVIEHNVRFGDPECQALVRLVAADPVPLLAQAAAGALVDEPVIGDGACVVVSLAAEGYPASVRTGDRVQGLAEAAALDGVELFMAGIDDEGRTAGGRVVHVSATGPTLVDAHALAYEAVRRISWPGMHYRTDIAAQALEGAA